MKRSTFFTGDPADGTMGDTGDTTDTGTEDLTGEQLFIENVRQGRGGTNYGSRLMYMPARTSAELSDAEITMIFDFVGTL